MKHDFSLLKLSVASLFVNPIRSFLAILGIMIGVAAVISVIAFGEGQRQHLEKEIAKMGADVFWIQSKRHPVMINKEQPPMPPHQAFLRNSDLNALRKFTTQIPQMAAFTSYFGAVFINSDKVDLTIVMTEPAYQDLGKLKLIHGRFISDLDVDLTRKVCVVEYDDHIKKYFAAQNPLESHVYVHNTRFKIIGLAKRRGDLPGGGFTSNLYLPLSAREYLNYGNHIDRIFCKTDNEIVNQAMRQAENVLKSRYRGEPYFEVLNAKIVYQSAQRITRTASLATAGIAAISLLVGGIGIMNIMLASVSERIREIGIRKSVGARMRDIRNQFLTEAILLTSIGGMIGIISGIFLAEAIGALINIPVTISIFSIVIGAGFSVMTGIIFGIYPALKAAKMPPIEALRHE